MRKEYHKAPSPRLIDARIRCDWRGFQPCEVRELDMNGVLVLSRDGTLSKLPKDAPVDVALKLDSGGRIRTHNLKARVEKKSAAGTSLVFTDAELDTFSILLDLAYGDQSDPAESS